jgi:hypothetical protein
VGFFFYIIIFINKDNMSKTKLIINERQLALITKLVKENVNKNIVKQVGNYLDTYYQPSYGTYKNKGEYNNTPMIMNKVDEELITPKNLLKHLIDKFELSQDFLSQIIRDWYDGQLDGEFMLSKNVMNQ